jgi:hypothetical protein
MTKRLLLITALLIPLAGATIPTLRAAAKETMDMMEMVMQAKTPADHEKLAAMYDQDAAEARSKAAMHKKMAEDIRKTGGALFAKLHYDQHCDGLVTSYTKAAEEYAALAKAERTMAKPM